MKSAISLALVLGASLWAVAMPAIAADMTEDQAKSKMEGAGYAEVSRLHQANAGEWMADAVKDGHPVMITLYPDGTVALREHVDVAPATPAGTVPAVPKMPDAAPAKP